MRHQLSREGGERLPLLGIATLDDEIVAFDVPQPTQRLQDRRLAGPPALAQAPDPVDLPRGLGLGGPSPHDHAAGEEDEASDHEAQHGSLLGKGGYANDTYLIPRRVTCCHHP